MGMMAASKRNAGVLVLTGQRSSQNQPSFILEIIPVLRRIAFVPGPSQSERAAFLGEALFEI
jgi:hypothetical protein